MAENEPPDTQGEATMEAVIFEVLTKAGFLAAIIIGFLVWNHMGQPMFTISRKG